MTVTQKYSYDIDMRRIMIVDACSDKSTRITLLHEDEGSRASTHTLGRLSRHVIKSVELS